MADPSTSADRLIHLATSLDDLVRAVALRHPALPEEIRQMLVEAAERPGDLSAPRLAWMVNLGPWAVNLVALHPAAEEATLRQVLVRGGLGPLLRRQVPPADAPGEGQFRLLPWVRQQAALDRAVAQALVSAPRVPVLLRRDARRLLTQNRFPVAEVPPQDETLDPATLRRKLRLRGVRPTFTAAEWDLIRERPALQRAAAQCATLPLPWLVQLDQWHPQGQARETLLAVLERDPLEPETLLQFSQQGDWELRAAVARNPQLPVSARRALVRDADWWVRACVAENPNAAPDELQALGAEEDHDVIRELVAAHPHTPAPTLERLAQDGERSVRLQVARNPGSSPGALALLAGDPLSSVREAVAAHPLTPEPLLSTLTQDREARVAQVGAARRADTPEQVQAASLSKRRFVRLALAGQPGLTGEVISRLAADRSPLVRAQTALQQKLTVSDRQRLMSDPALDVRRLAISTDPQALPATLSQMPQHDVRVRQGLSRHARTPPELLERLSDDPLRDIRHAVVLNPSAPPGALQRRLGEQTLRPAIRRHPKYQGIRAELRALELKEVNDPLAPLETLRTLLQSDAPDVRTLLASHARLDEEGLLRLGSDDAAEVRSALAERPTLSGDLLGLLARDPAPGVRWMVARRSDLPTGAILSMAQRPDEDEDLLWRLLRHKNASDAVAAMLARHPSQAMRAAAAGSQLVSGEVQWRLSTDTAFVVQALLKNAALQPDLLEFFAAQPQHAEAVLRHPAVTGRALELIARDEAFERLQGQKRLLARLPAWLGDSALARSWTARQDQRASQRAFERLQVLSAVVRHERASEVAVASAMRLNHPEMLAALESRQRRLEARGG